MEMELGYDPPGAANRFLGSYQSCREISTMYRRYAEEKVPVDVIRMQSAKGHS